MGRIILPTNPRLSRRALSAVFCFILVIFFFPSSMRGQMDGFTPVYAEAGAHRVQSILDKIHAEQLLSQLLLLPSSPATA
ncbi:MAG: hypothetical protein AAFV07_06030, partial [Bacteroidota bacterium]